MKINESLKTFIFAEASLRVQFKWKECTFKWDFECSRRNAVARSSHYHGYFIRGTGIMREIFENAPTEKSNVIG